jgi:hypothetical protein
MYTFPAGLQRASAGSSDLTAASCLNIFLVQFVLKGGYHEQGIVFMQVIAQ